MDTHRKVGATVLVLLAAQIACNPSPQLSNPGAMPFENAGFSVAIDGGRAIVGAARSDTLDSNGGKALTYGGGGSSWSLTQTIVPGTPSHNAHFGWSVGVSGERAVIGAFNDVSIGAITGAAYIFERDGGSWTEMARVLGDTLVEDGFGAAVAIDGDHVVVGAPYAPPPTFTGAGAAWVYRRNAGGNWILQQELEASDAVDYIEFGTSAAIDGDVIAVGARRGVAGGTVAGAVYVFRRQGNNWNEEAKLVALDPGYHDFFGTSVSVSGDVIVVGSPEDDPNGDASGSAYVFRRDAATGVWSQHQKLVADDGGNGDNFGRSVSVDGPRAMVGAWLADGDTSTTGAAYLFRASPTDWQLDQKLYRSNGEYGDGFGFSVSVSNDCAIVGAVNDEVGGMQQAGSAFIFCGLPGALPPGGFTLDIVCCIEVPDPLGPVVVTTTLANESDGVRIGRRWIEWIDAEGNARVVAGPEGTTVSPGETLEERQALPVDTSGGGRIVLYWADRNGVRTATTQLPDRPRAESVGGGG